MFHGDSGLDSIFTHDSLFEVDTSKRGNGIKEKIAIARGSLILDQPFFGYLLAHFEIIPVSSGINSFAADTNHLYINTDYFYDLIQYNENWKGKIKGILIHMLIHIIYRHHRRQSDRINKLWGIACDIVVFTQLQEIKKSWITPADWELPHLDSITPELQHHNAEKTYDLLVQQIEENTEENNQGRGAGNGEDEEDLKEDDNLEELVMEQDAMIDEMFGTGINCDLEQILDLSQSTEFDELEEQYFEGILQTAYERQKNFGSLPEGLDRWVKERLSVQVDWKAKLTKYLQNIIPHDLTWTRPNTRMISQGYYFPGTLKTNTEIIMGVDTSGSIDDELLGLFLSEAQAILETITNVKLIVVDCDAEIQQIHEYEPGESVNSHRFKGSGGTDFRPVFSLADKSQADVIIYITDGYGTYPKKAPSIPVIWVLTTDEQPSFGEIVRLDISRSLS